MKDTNSWDIPNWLLAYMWTVAILAIVCMVYFSN